MNISLRQLRAFATINQLGSFTKAAGALHATQPALSAQITELEHTLGVRLFDRSTRSVVITQAGRDLLPVVDKILADVDLVLTHAHGIAQGNIGRVAVAALPSVSSTTLPQAVAHFRRQFPGITISLKDALAARIVQMIRDDEVDFGITSPPTGDAQLEFTPLASDRMVAVLPRNHPLANARRIKLVDLLDTPLILMDRDSSVRRIVDAASASLGRIATPAYEPAFMATAIGMVRAGLGITLLPSSAVEITSGEDLVTHPLEERELTRQIGVLRKRARLLSPAADSFVRTLRTHARDWFNQSLPLTLSPSTRRQRDEPLSRSRPRAKRGSPANAKRRK